MVGNVGNVGKERGGVPVEQMYGLLPSELITALRTLPQELYPHYSKITLDPKTEEGIIPCSTVNLEWTKWGEIRMFIPRFSRPFDINLPEDPSPEQLQEIKRALLMGNKPARVLYEIDSRSAYGMFIDKELEQQVINGSYQIKYAKLNILSDTGVSFVRSLNGEYSADLAIGRELSPENKIALENWYSSLSSLHPFGQVTKSE
jgi:hypothetical protein